MPIQLDTETLVSFAALAESMPPRRKKRPVHVSTIHRWRHPGLRGVRLEALRVGGAGHTTWEAFARFCERLTATEYIADTPSITSTSRKREQDAADVELAKEGW